jgi:hypothetical protein
VINQRSAADTLRIKRGVAQSGLAEGGQADILASEQTAAQQRVAIEQGKLARVAGLERRGVISAQQAADLRLKIEQGLTQEQTKLVDLQAQQVQLAEKRKLDAISQRATAGTLNLKESQLNGTVIGDGGQAEINKLEERAAQERVAIEQDKLAKIQQLRQSGTLSATAAGDAEQAINQRLSAEQSKLLDLRTQRELRAIQVGVDSQKRASDSFVRQLDRQKAAQDSFAKALERQSQLLNARSGLNQAVAGERESALKNAIARAGETIETIKKLQSGDVGDNTRQVLQQQLGTSVIGDNQLLKAIKDKQSLEREADEEKAASIARQQALERQSNELKIKQGELAAKNNLREAERAELLARQNKNEAEGNVLKALKTGDKNEIENAKAGLELAKQGVDLAQAGVQDARAGVSSQKETAQVERETIQVKQRTEVNDFNANAAANQRKRDLELAGVGDELGVNVSIKKGQAPQIASLPPISNPNDLPAARGK